MTSSGYWSVVLDKNARKVINKIPKQDVTHISNWIDAIDAIEAGEIHPRSGDVKKLKKYIAGYRKRIGNYRIFFDIYEREIVVYIVDVRRRTSTTYR